jgi:hypothetical protein
MAAADQYALDISSVTSLIKSWQGGAEAAGKISQELAAIHNQLESSIPSALVEGLLGEVPLMECFARLAAATKAASTVSQGLMQDTSTLDQNLAAYIKAEQEAEAKFKAVQAKQKQAEKDGSTQTAGRGATHSGGSGSGTSGGGGSSSGGGGGSSSGGSGGSGSSGGSGGSSGGSGGGGSTQPPGPPNYANQGQVEQWINQAFQILEANGVPASELNEAGVLLIIEHESSGNPNAINNWDSNAKAGDPSRGLMQTIGTTFDAYKLPGHNDIYNPVDNIIAGVRYAISRYGSIQNVPGVKSVDNGGSYVGY